MVWGFRTATWVLSTSCILHRIWIRRLRWSTYLVNISVFSVVVYKVCIVRAAVSAHKINDLNYSLVKIAHMLMQILISISILYEIRLSSIMNNWKLKIWIIAERGKRPVYLNPPSNGNMALNDFLKLHKSTVTASNSYRFVKQFIILHHTYK